MPKPILAGYDPSTADPTPVRFGIAAARFTGAPLVVGAIHADRGHRHLEHGLPDDAEGALAELRAELDAEDVSLEYRLLAGASAPRALHEAAEELGAGLLVVGSTRRGRAGRVLLGSTAQRLLHGAGCPVAVIPHAWKPQSRTGVIGVAYTDTPEGHEALRAALALARAAGATLRVLTATKPHGFDETQGGGPLKEATTYGEVGSALRAQAEVAVQDATAGVGDVPIEPDVSVQDPADFLIAASERLDLLICGSRGYGPQRAVLVGGVTRRVTAEAYCPVVVLARGGGGLDGLLGDASQAVAEGSGAGGG